MKRKKVKIPKKADVILASAILKAERDKREEARWQRRNGPIVVINGSPDADGTIGHPTESNRPGASEGSGQS